MSDSEGPSHTSSRNSKPLRLQFSLLWLLVAVTGVAVLLGLAIAAERFLTAWVLTPIVFLVVPTALVSCAIYARGELQTFAFGTLVPYLSFFLGSPLFGSVRSLASWFGAVLWLVVMSGVCGLVAVATRRWIERRGSDQ